MGQWTFLHGQELCLQAILAVSSAQHFIQYVSVVTYR